MKQAIWKAAKPNKASRTDVFSFNLLNKYTKGAETITSPIPGGQVLLPPAVLPLFSKRTNAADMAIFPLVQTKASPADTKRPGSLTDKKRKGRFTYIINQLIQKTTFKPKVDWNGRNPAPSVSAGELERCPQT